jgi:hypothetical protein
MIKKKSVKFADIAADLNDEVEASSNLRRIQNFFALYALDYLSYARLFMSFIPLHRLDLILDRTNWTFGDVDINILSLNVRYRGVSVPIFFDLLDKKGNSTSDERIDLLGKFITQFGQKRIASLTADREFIGDDWYNYLITNKIPFFIRLPKSHRVTLGGIHYRIDTLINAYASKGEKQINNIEMHDITPLSIGLKKLPKDGKKRLEDEYLAVLSNCSEQNILKMYRKRWAIETFFQSIKERGFDIEQTHLQQLDRLKKLFALVSLAFVLCLSVGIEHHENVKTIETKNHGYKQNAFFRVGLDKLKRAIKYVFVDISSLNSLLITILINVRENFIRKKLDRSFIM